MRLGDLNLVQTNDNAMPQTIAVKERIRYPEYKRPSEYHDIAILRLQKDATYNAYVRPACLPVNFPDVNRNELVTATGWGLVDWGKIIKIEIFKTELLKLDTLAYVITSYYNTSYPIMRKRYILFLYMYTYKINMGISLNSPADDKGSDNLLKVTLSLVSHQSCNASFFDGTSSAELPNGIVNDWQLCAGEVGKDTCQVIYLH